MVRTDNLRIERFSPLTPPDAIKAELPLTARAADTVVMARAGLENILSQRDRRLIAIVGPCSIHSREDAVEYATRLRRLARELERQLLVVMRVYFEKPRTMLGWKGLIYDPAMNDTCDIETGLRLARRILLEINELGVPAGAEILEPVVPQYFTDLVSWAAIGARTAESQTHRQMASGLSMPIGFKNSTDGSMKVAVDAIRTAASPHTFIGVTGDGRVATFRTCGNRFGHLVLRGGYEGPNYTSEHLAFAQELLRQSGVAPNLMVDCSHANSGKDPQRQMAVLREVLAQIRGGTGIIRGIMLESHLLGGRQEIPVGGKPQAGLSVTDACLGWDDTERLLREAAAVVAEVAT
ncbi:MAG: 3-deoxy-7-phosphoheptulonate synthase [bacterium]